MYVSFLNLFGNPVVSFANSNAKTYKKAETIAYGHNEALRELYNQGVFTYDYLQENLVKTLDNNKGKSVIEMF